MPSDQPDKVKPGQKWNKRYLVETSVGEPVDRWFKAIDDDLRTEVLLRVTHSGSATGRAAVWQKIHGVDSPLIQRSLAVHEGPERVEVWAALQGPTLRSWRLAGGNPGKERLLPIIRQLTAAIESLHQAGVAHFSLNADVVHILEGESGPVVTLGGYDHAAFYLGTELIPLPVDPESAPPEAAGLFKHSPGDLLKSWDWWSLGRLLQELVLGRHVAELLPEKHRARPLPVCAEALLFERDIQGVRAGAVELMPELDKSLALLLRGLLTTAVTGRWSGLEVREWLEGRQPPERYAAARHEQFYRHQDRGYTVPEFARLLQASPEAAEPIRHLFATKDKDTLAAFMGENPGSGDAAQCLIAARELTGAVALRPFAEPLRQEVAAAVAWHEIAGGSFRWRGQPLGMATLREQLKNPDVFREWRTALQALATPLVLNYINEHDPEAVRLLERLVRTAGEVEELAVKSRWLKPNDPATQAALWQASLESDTALLSAQQKLHEQYATSDDDAFQKVFEAPRPTRVMQVLIAWAEGNPRTFRLVTHEEMRQRREKALLHEGAALARLIFWLRLDRAMRAGPWLFGGRWFLILAGMVIISLLAIHVPGPWGLALGLLPLLVLAAARLWVNRSQAGLVKTWSPDSPPWGWRAGPGRSAEEVRALARQHGGLSTLTGALAAMKQVTQELKKLAASNAPAVAPPKAPQHAATWSVVAFGWLVVLGIGAGSVNWGLAHPPSWKVHTAAWQKSVEKEKRPKPTEPGDIKITWPYKVPQDAFEITLKGAFTPTAAQADAAVRHGKALVKPYKPETISSLVAIYVPLKEGQGGRHGLLLFDGKKGALLGHAGVIIDYVPFARTAMQVGDQMAFFVEN